MTPFLFTHNRFSPYAKTKDASSMRTRERKAERNRGRIVWNNGTYVRAIHGKLK